MASGLIAITDLPSSVADGGFGTRERIDPFYGGLWGYGLRPTWTDKKTAVARAAIGLSRPPAWALEDDGEAIERIVRPSRGRPPWSERLTFLAAINEWRNVTVQQLACITGCPSLANPESVVLRDAYAAGLVDVGGMADVFSRGPVQAEARMLRPARGDAFARRLAPHLTLPELTQVTGGVAWRGGGTYGRHDLLTTELALRVAEFCEVGTVLGELHSSIELLTASNVGTPVQESIGKSADAVIVRADGMRIAVEMTATVGANFSAKVERWAKALSETPWDLSGLMVVFVVAPTEGNHTSVMAETRRQINKAIKRYPGSARDWIPERMGLVHWKDWFPQDGYVAREFLDLTVERPTGSEGERWQKVGLLDILDVPFEPYAEHDSTAVLRAAPWLLGSPHWLRNGIEPHPNLWPLAVERTGELTLPTASRYGEGHDGPTSHAFGAGIATAPLPPARLRPVWRRTAVTRDAVGTSAA